MHSLQNINMKIKNIFFTLLFVSITSLASIAQFTNCKVSEIEKLKQSGTVTVAISDDDATNKSVQEILTSYWTASKFSVIKKSELEAYVKTNPENYVLTYLVDNSSSVFTMTSTQTASANKNGRTQTKTVGDGLILTQNLKKIKKLKPTDAMVYCFIDSDLDLISQQAEFIRQVGAINAILTFPNLQDKQIGGWKIPTLNQKEIIKKELWIADTDLNKKGEDEAKMKSAYNPYKYKIVSKEEIAKSILEKRKDIVYIARAEYQAGAYMFIVHNPENNRVLFFLGGTGGFDSKQFEKIKTNKAYGQ
ncbi:MAG: hypothetical protein A3F72_02125 [Bacteroidetes bacterium RIFCSPLOWO2_12_FULL_35_15]|nr:MAG: hypothetical protein A3F72_02125 [Bacteroidetes bacterium RIFCSPLOWO2_12_FULL_35_15]